MGIPPYKASNQASTLKVRVRGQTIKPLPVRGQLWNPSLSADQQARELVSSRWPLESVRQPL
jgi:hypothetical protein